MNFLILNTCYVMLFNKCYGTNVRALTLNIKIENETDK